MAKYRCGGGGNHIIIDGDEYKDNIILSSATNAYEVLAGTPCGGMMSPVYLNDVLFMIGADVADDYYKFYKYENSAWVKLANYPVYSVLEMGSLYNGQIYYYGGKHPSDNSQIYKNLIYNPDDNTWTYSTDCPLGFYYSGSCVFNNLLHIYGGPNSSGSHYTFNGNEWACVGSNPCPMYGLGSATVLNGKIYIKQHGTTYIYESADGVVYTQTIIMPRVISLGNLIGRNDSLYLFGGSDGSVLQSKYKDGKWFSMPNIYYNSWSEYMINCSKGIFMPKIDDMRIMLDDITNKTFKIV